MTERKKVLYIIKVKGKAKIPDYVQVRDENFTLIGYFRPGRPEKNIKTLAIPGYQEKIETHIQNIPFGKITRIEI